MKKIMLLMSFMTILLFSVNANTFGVLGKFTNPGFAVTGSFGKVEAELGVTDLTSGVLSLSADYNIINKGIVNDLFWNIGAGAGISISSSSVVVSAIAPVELVFNIDEILNGMDIYLQAMPIVSIIPQIDFGFDLGLGVRFAY